MIINLSLEKDKKGNIKNAQATSVDGELYQPSEDVKFRTAQVISDLEVANDIRERPFLEFNGVSMIDRLNASQRSYNQFVTAPSDDEAQQWRSRAFRPIVRNKIISIAAHMTALVIFPKVFAQNENDDEDKDAAMIMSNLLEYLLDQGYYEEKFLYSVLAALINPVSYIHVEYSEAYRKVKEYTSQVGEQGGEEMEEEKDEKEVFQEMNNKKWKEKIVKDDLFSGYQINVVPCDELWISNPYENNIQKQPYLVWRKVIDYTTAKAKYGFNENFNKYVKPGVQFILNDDKDTFYEQYDDDLVGNMVEELIYYNRMADLQLTFVNGVLLDHVDNPNPRKDKNYPFVKGGYETFDEGRFFYYKSLADKLSEDEAVINTIYQMVIDGTYLQVMPPAVSFGNEQIGSSVMMPGSVTNIDMTDNPSAAFQPIQTGSNLNAAYSLLDKVEMSMTESSTSDLAAGIAPSGTQTAFEISRLEQNSRVLLQLFGKMISFMVRDLGLLAMNDVLQFMTVAEVSEIQSEAGNLKFGNFLLPKNEVMGRNKTSKIQFDMEMPDEDITKEELLKMSEEIWKEQRKLGDDVEIYKVNPKAFRNLKFKVKVQPKSMLPRSESLEKAQNLEAYSFAVQNPLSNLEAVTKTLLFGSFDATKDDPESFMKQPEEMQAQQPQAPKRKEGAATEEQQIQQEAEQAVLAAGSQPQTEPLV
jgi:hypothetical protein